jgi:hypothetical protein
MFYYSRDRRGEHPKRIWPDMPASCRPTPMTGTTSSIWRDATLDRSGKPIREAACWVHARRKAAGKKEIPLSPIAVEVVRRIDALFEIERSINGRSAEERVQVRQTLTRPLVEDLQVYMREQLAKLVPWERPRQGVQLHPEAMAELHAVPGGRTGVSLQQCRRKRLYEASLLAAGGAPQQCTA